MFCINKRKNDNFFKQKTIIKIRKKRGVILAELIVSFSVLALLLVGLSISLYAIAKFNLFQLVRQQCIAAGQAQLDSINATGQPIPEEQFEQLWPKIDVTIEQTDGIDQWEGLKLVIVKTSGMSYSAKVNVELSRYIRMQKIIAQQEN